MSYQRLLCLLQGIRGTTCPMRDAGLSVDVTEAIIPAHLAYLSSKQPLLFMYLIGRLLTPTCWNKLLDSRGRLQAACGIVLQAPFTAGEG